VSGGVVSPVVLVDSPNDNPINYNGTGTLQLKDVVSGTVINNNVGTVNYATGVLSLTSFVPIGYPTGQNDLRITVEMQESSYDLAVNREQILVLDDSTLDSQSNRLQGLTVTAVDVAL
jgi:hypothetical protein